MNWRRLGLMILVIGALALGFSYFRRQVTVDSHRHARQLVLYYTLSRVENPIVVLGDSITEASTLPRGVCGHPIVNAGLNGASTASDLGSWLVAALDGKRASEILVELGTNDALLARSAEAYEASFASLLTQLAGVTDHLAVLGIPAIDVRGNVTAELQGEAMRRIDAFNALLPALASKHGANFVALPAMPVPHTIDGVHLSAAGYAVWDDAVLKGVSACSPH